jgi:hypothetical protein
MELWLSPLAAAGSKAQKALAQKITNPARTNTVPTLGEYLT